MRGFLANDVVAAQYGSDVPPKSRVAPRGMEKHPPCAIKSGQIAAGQQRVFQPGPLPRYRPGKEYGDQPSHQKYERRADDADECDHNRPGRIDGKQPWMGVPGLPA